MVSFLTNCVEKLTSEKRYGFFNYHCMYCHQAYTVPEQEAKVIMRRLTEAVVYMHDNGEPGIILLNYAFYSIS